MIPLGGTTRVTSVTVLSVTADGEFKAFTLSGSDMNTCFETHYQRGVSMTIESIEKIRGDQTPSDLAIAALEAAGIETEGPDPLFVQSSSVERSADMRRSALYLLKRAAAIDAYHARPKVTDAQMARIAEASGLFRSTVEAVLNAAVDDGWTPPADKEEQ